LATSARTCSRRIAMICSALNRLPFIVRPLLATDSTSTWRNFRGSGHASQRSPTGSR
jgi:hypothetical protein